ncbi:MAG: hypothetical protein PF637_04105 [Spirochaetes bacterium]|nr:hypothetical protein [Spirochaetota bacterium]
MFNNLLFSAISAVIILGLAGSVPTAWITVRIIKKVNISGSSNV